MKNLIEYLTYVEILYSVTLPLVFVIYWWVTEMRKPSTDATILWHWGLCALGSYVLSFWTVTPEFRELHIINVFFIYLAVHLYLRQTITPLAAYSLTFLCIFVIDLVRAAELVKIGAAKAETFYWGVGGAGALDGLCIFPILAAVLVQYVKWRTKERDLTVPFFNVPSENPTPLSACSPQP